MNHLLKKVHVVDPRAGLDQVCDVLIGEDAIILDPAAVSERYEAIPGEGLYLFPGLVDLHVHFREPGFMHKEDIGSGIRAALAGGVTSALAMPNTDPAIDNFKLVDYQLKRAKRSGFDLMVAACASKGLMGREAVDVGEVKRAGAMAITDDGKPIKSDLLMENILRQCRRHDLVCMQHAEDLDISHNAPLNLGKVSEKTQLMGQSSKAESSLIARDIGLARKISARYHVLHLSCKESLSLLREVKRDSKLFSCEVAPHHLLLSEYAASGLDTNKKMIPPLRSREDVQSLVEGLEEGIIDAVSSDHAPHSEREKALSFADAPFGVVGLESSILVLLTLVKNRRLSLNRAIASMTANPAKILGQPDRIGTLVGPHALKNAVLVDIDHRSVFSQRHLKGRSKNSAFLGMELYGRVLATFLNGRLAYRAF